jgi:hypothetical protein
MNRASRDDEPTRASGARGERSSEPKEEAGEGQADPRRRPASMPPHIDPTKVAGNAQFDPAEQTHRIDMPDDEQKAEGEPGRGNLPSRAPDRSRQPRTHEE